MSIKKSKENSEWSKKEYAKISKELAERSQEENDN